MKRVFVCSPLRGPDGQPSAENIALARRLMRAVFDAGHAPFVPHLLYPQVLSESEADRCVAFHANYRFMDVCDEVWIYARGLEACSTGMHIECTYVLSRPQGQRVPRLVFMPPEFEAVRLVLAAEKAQAARPPPKQHCIVCQNLTEVNRSGECLPCFSAGSAT